MTAEVTTADRAWFALIVFVIVYAILIGISYFIRWRTNKKIEKLQQIINKTDPHVEELRKLSVLYENAESDEERERIQAQIDEVAQKISLILDEALEVVK